MNNFFNLSKWITEWCQKPHNFTEFDYHMHNHSQNYDYNWLTDNKKWRPLAGAENLVSTLYGNIGVIGLCFILLSV